MSTMSKQQRQGQGVHPQFVVASYAVTCSGTDKAVAIKESSCPGNYRLGMGPKHHPLLSLAAMQAPIVELPTIRLPSWLTQGNGTSSYQLAEPATSITAPQSPSNTGAGNRGLLVSTQGSIARQGPPTLVAVERAPLRRFPPIRRKKEEAEVAAAAAATTAAATTIEAAAANCVVATDDIANEYGTSNVNSVPATQRKAIWTVETVVPENEAASFAVERTTGRKRIYHAALGVDAASGRSWEGFEVVDEPQTMHSHGLRLMNAYLLPQGFPDSVAPQYATYMGWRGVQYFFGGAISVFTTQSLLGALGVAGRYSGEAAAAINWVIKDGAGRLGRLLFARWGRELDCELKQFRLAGDLLMESGAAMELATVLAPRMFLPLACTANLAKNLAAVAASSTRAPIYRTFARTNNLADITAKGESVANLADILGTVFGIALSRSRLPMLGCFLALSAGYLVASRQEVDSVELPYLNRARLAYSTKEFLRSGAVPGIPEANHHEPLLPWGDFNQQRIVLGSSVSQACAAPSDLRLPLALHQNERFVITYRPETQKVYVLLRDGATAPDFLKAAFTSHVFLHIVDGKPVPAASVIAPPDEIAAAAAAAAATEAKSKRWFSRTSKREREEAAAAAPPPLAAAAAEAAVSHSGTADITDVVVDAAALPWHLALLETHVLMDRLYPEFLLQAEERGWQLNQTMLNPRETRLLRTAIPMLAE